MASPPASSRSLYTAKPSARRTAAVLAGIAIVLAAIAAVVLGVLGGSSSSKASNAASTTSAAAGSKHAATHPHAAPHRSTAAASSETTVTVLNATEANGLAHRTAAELQQNGYSLASAQSGRPPGSGQVSLVEYASGHKLEAEGVARSLAITHVLPIEAGVSALAGSASVVVIVGADRAAQTQ